MISAYQRAKFSAIKIIGQKISCGVNHNLMMNTVSQTIPNHQLCSSCVSKKDSIDECLTEFQTKQKVFTQNDERIEEMNDF